MTLLDHLDSLVESYLKAYRDYEEERVLEDKENGILDALGYSEDLNDYAKVLEKAFQTRREGFIHDLMGSFLGRGADFSHYKQVYHLLRKRGFDKGGYLRVIRKHLAASVNQDPDKLNEINLGEWGWADFLLEYEIENFERRDSYFTSEEPKWSI